MVMFDAVGWVSLIPILFVINNYLIFEKMQTRKSSTTELIEEVKGREEKKRTPRSSMLPPSALKCNPHGIDYLFQRIYLIPDDCREALKMHWQRSSITHENYAPRGLQ